MPAAAAALASLWWSCVFSVSTTCPVHQCLTHSVLTLLSCPASQVQKLKVDTESAMLEIDQILKANELSIALVAAVPSFLIAGLSVVGIWRWLSPKPVDPKYEALPCRYSVTASAGRCERAGNTGFCKTVTCLTFWPQRICKAIVYVR